MKFQLKHYNTLYAKSEIHDDLDKFIRQRRYLIFWAAVAAVSGVVVRFMDDQGVVSWFVEETEIYFFLVVLGIMESYLVMSLIETWRRIRHYEKHENMITYKPTILKTITHYMALLFEDDDN